MSRDETLDELVRLADNLGLLLLIPTNTTGTEEADR